METVEEKQADGTVITKTKRKKKKNTVVDLDGHTVEIPDSVQDSADEAKQRMLSDLNNKRASIISDPDLDDDERTRQLTKIDNDIEMMTKLLGSEAAAFFAMYMSNKRGSGGDDVEDEDVARTKAMLEQQHAELLALEEAHRVEEEQLERQMDEEDRAAEQAFELDMTRLNSIFGDVDPKELSLEEADPDAKKKRKHARAGSQSLLSEYEIDISTMKANGESADAVKEKIKNIHAQKRAELREKRRSMLKKRQDAALSAAHKKEDEIAKELDAQTREQSEMLALLDGINGQRGTMSPTNGDGEPGAVHQDIRAKRIHEMKAKSIERRYMREQLDAEANSCMDEAIGWAFLELKAAKIDVTPAETSRGELKSILEETVDQSGNYDISVETEKQRQQKLLHERLTANKKNKSSAAQRRKEEELRAEEKRNEEMLRIAKKQTEMETIKLAVSKLANELEKRKHARKVVEMVFQQRQNRECEQQLRHHFEERAHYFKELLESDESLDMVEIERSTCSRFDGQQAKDIADLQAQHRTEIRDAIRELFPDEDFTSEEWANDIAEADHIADVQRKRRELIERQLAAETTEREHEIARLKAETEQRKKAHDQMVEDERAEFERIQLEFQRRETERLNKKRALEEEAQRREIEQLQGISEQQREDILAQHRVNIKNYERALDNERARQASGLEKSLEERRKKRALLKARKKAEAEKEKQIEAKIRTKVKKELVKQQLTDETVAAQTSGWHQRAGSVSLPPGMMMVPGMTIPGMIPNAAFMASNAAAFAQAGDHDNDDHVDGMTRAERRRIREEREQRELQEKMEVMERLKKIETMVGVLNGDVTSWRSQVYHDDQDMKNPAYQPNPSITSPIPCEMNELDTRSFILYRFGINLIDMLHTSGLSITPHAAKRTPASTPVQLLIAKSLPAPQHPQTAFHHSFWYDATSHTLFIRRERLQHVGDFIFVLIHCLAHLSASVDSQIWDDRHPIFMATFYSMLRICCTELFYSRASHALKHAGITVPAIMTDKKESKEQTYPSSSTLFPDLIGTARDTAIDEMMDLHPLHGTGPAGGNVMDGGANTAFFNTHRLMERMSEYHTFTQSSLLRSHLLEVEATASRHDHIREVAEEKTFRTRVRTGATPHIDLSDTTSRAGAIVDEAALDTIADQLNSELVTVVEQMYEAASILQTNEQIRATESKENITIIDTINKQRDILTRLTSTKDQLTSRLRNVQEAQAELAKKKGRDGEMTPQ